MLEGFLPEENALEVLDGGVQSTVQDADGMIGYWTVGVPPCGAMDAYSFKIGNCLVTTLTRQVLSLQCAAAHTDSERPQVFV